MSLWEIRYVAVWNINVGRIVYMGWTTLSSQIIYLRIKGTAPEQSEIYYPHDKSPWYDDPNVGWTPTQQMRLPYLFPLFLPWLRSLLFLLLHFIIPFPSSSPSWAFDFFSIEKGSTVEEATPDDFDADISSVRDALKASRTACRLSSGVGEASRGIRPKLWEIFVKMGLVITLSDGC